MSPGGWYVWSCCEYNAAGDLVRVTTVRTDTLDRAAAERAYCADMARHAAAGYPCPASFSVVLSR